MPKDRSTRRRLRKVLPAAYFVAGVLATLVIQDVYREGKEAAFPKAPLSPWVEQNPADWEAGNPFGGEAYQYVVPSDPSELSAPPGGRCYQRYGWARALDGVDADTSRFQVYLQARTDEPIVLRRIEAEVHRRSAPRGGTLLTCTAGGGMGRIRHLAVDLDAGTVQFDDGEGRPISGSFLKFQRGESEAISVVASTSRCDCTWRLRFHLLVGGEPRVVRVPRGTPLRTMSSRHAMAVTWRDGRWSRRDANS